MKRMGKVVKGRPFKKKKKKKKKRKEKLFHCVLKGFFVDKAWNQKKLSNGA